MGTDDMELKKQHAVDIGSLAEAPLFSETSFSDIRSADRLQLSTQFPNRVVGAAAFPTKGGSRPQTTKDIKPGQAASGFHPDAAHALKLTSAGFQLKRPTTPSAHRRR